MASHNSFHHQKYDGLAGLPDKSWQEWQGHGCMVAWFHGVILSCGAGLPSVVVHCSWLCCMKQSCLVNSIFTKSFLKKELLEKFT
jgi:hypothetical protein